MNAINLTTAINARLQKIKEQGNYRVCPITERPNAHEIIIAGKKYINFASNDYLGLSMYPEITDAFIEGIRLYGAGTGASPLVTGLTEAHEELHEKIKKITGKEDVLLFSTGFAANQALIKCFAGLGYTPILDKLDHASMQDAVLSIKEFHRFPHKDITRARAIAQNTINPVIFTEGVFSMDGDLSDLKSLSKIRTDLKLPLVIDDAHGFGVIGKHGWGTLYEEDLTFNDADVIMCTLSKAIGTEGAFIAADKEFIAWMVNTAREYIYSTAAPAALAFAASKSLDIMQAADDRREHLKHLISLFHEETKDFIPQDNPYSQTPIQPVIIGSTNELMLASEIMKNNNIWCGMIRSPTVPRGTDRFRITITAAHTDNDIEILVAALKKIFRK